MRKIKFSGIIIPPEYRLSQRIEELEKELKEIKQKKRKPKTSKK